MLRVLLTLGQVLVVAPAAYSSLIALWGLRTPAPGRTGSDRKVRVIVAAHDEATVIGGIASDLAGQDYPEDLLSSVVVADRCSDDTADIAAAFVDVAERRSGAGGKGAAIAWYLEEHPLSEDEAVIILDADNRVDQDYVRAIAGEFDAGSQVVQTYLDVANPDGSVLATAGALTYWASNRMVQLARSNLGWSCDLGGTGMAFTGRALEDAGGFVDDLTDDLALNVRLNLAGYRATWIHHVRVYDEKPTDTKSTIAQRARWVRGKRDVQRAYGATLVKRALTRREPALLDLAFRLYNPGRSFIALSIGGLTLVSAALPALGLWPWQVLGAVTGVVVLLPTVFLAVEGVPVRYIVRYPFITVLAVMWVPIRVASRLVAGWQRTQHEGA
jgi:cellulose synthase/poly-beta-1,6-N-acetylglucosamine synthase-like glycosyltransferase